MIIVNLKEGESIDRALKRFKQRCQRAGIHRDLKRSSFYLKPSEKKKIAKNLARKRHRKALTQT
ncbi:MAG: 30S ribosomal protein S21 [bacterium]